MGLSDSPNGFFTIVQSMFGGKKFDGIKKEKKVETHEPLEKQRVSGQGREARSLRRGAILA